jgi:hypothetical protein
MVDLLFSIRLFLQHVMSSHLTFTSIQFRRLGTFFPGNYGAGPSRGVPRLVRVHHEYSG